MRRQPDLMYLQRAKGKNDRDKRKAMERAAKDWILCKRQVKGTN